MKFSTLLGLATLFLSLGAFAQNTSGDGPGNNSRGPVASLEFTCELGGMTRTGTVEINDQLVVGPASCMYFGNGPTYCFRFERHVRIKNIHLALRYADQLRAGLDSNFISLDNIPYSEGATSINTVKVGLLKTEELSCLYSNVKWSH